MKSILQFFLILILSYGTLKAQLNQEWIRSYNGPVNGNDEALTHTIDNAGNVYAAGKIVGSATGFDIYTVKYNSTGNVLWEKIYNGPGNGNDIPASIMVDNSGNVFVTGESNGVNTNSDYVLIKYNSNGEEQWGRRYDGASSSVDIPVSVNADNMNNVIITGKSHEAASLFNIVTIKYNADGLQQWIKTFEEAGNVNEMADDMVIDASGNIYISGSDLGATTLNDFLLIKYNSSGDELWAKRYNGTANANDMLTSVALDNNGNILQTGSSVGVGTSLDYATIKYSPSGEELWIKRYDSQGNSTFDEPKSVSTDIYGNVYVTGASANSFSSYDYLTVKYSSSGEELWAKRYNGPSSFNFDEARSVAADINGNAYVAGFSAGTGSMDDIVIVKYDAVGGEVWVTRYNSPANRDDAASNLSLDANGSIIVSGIITGAATSKDFAVIKFSQLTNLNTISSGNISGYKLFQNYPNPFNPATIIKFDISQDASREMREVRLVIYNALGKEVATLVDEILSTGSYEVEFNGEDYPSGIYFYKLSVMGRVDEFSEVKRMILIK